MQEPGSNVSKWGVLIALLVVVLGWWFFGALPGILMGVLTLGGLLSWPLFVMAMRWRSKRITIEGLGTFSALSLESLNHTADDSRTKTPGKLLYAFGGAGPLWGFAWRDGGKPFASGGYIQVPNSAPRLLSPDHLYLPVVPHRCELDSYSLHFQATVEEHGYNLQNSLFFTSTLMHASRTAATEKALDLEAVLNDRNQRVADLRDLASDVEGHHLTQLDSIKKGLDLVNPPKRGFLGLGKGKQEREEEQEPQNGD